MFLCGGLEGRLSELFCTVLCMADVLGNERKREQFIQIIGLVLGFFLCFFYLWFVRFVLA